MRYALLLPLPAAVPDANRQLLVTLVAQQASGSATFTWTGQAVVSRRLPAAAGLPACPHRATPSISAAGAQYQSWVWMPALTAMRLVVLGTPQHGAAWAWAESARAPAPPAGGSSLRLDINMPHHHTRQEHVQQLAGSPPAQQSGPHGAGTGTHSGRPTCSACDAQEEFEAAGAEAAGCLPIAGQQPSAAAAQRTAWRFISMSPQHAAWAAQLAADTYGAPKGGAGGGAASTCQAWAGSAADWGGLLAPSPAPAQPAAAASCPAGAQPQLPHATSPAADACTPAAWQLHGVAWCSACLAAGALAGWLARSQAWPAGRPPPPAAAGATSRTVSLAWQAAPTPQAVNEEDELQLHLDLSSEVRTATYVLLLCPNPASISAPPAPAGVAL